MLSGAQWRELDKSLADGCGTKSGGASGPDFRSRNGP